MTKSFTTLDDVAKVAGMSRAQVSRALRCDPGVRPETRKRIEAIAAQMNYKPNLAARSLVSSTSSIVGLVIGDLNNPFHIQLAQSLDAQLLARGFDPVTSLRALETGSALLDSDRLLRLRAAGVILIGTSHTSQVIGQIAEKLPCVFLGNKRVSHPQVVSIVVDDESGVRQAMAHLFSLGHRRIAHLGGGNEPSARERTRIYCRVMHEAGLEPIVLRGTHTATFGRQGVDALFAEGHGPTAIFAANDCIAVGVLDRLMGMGLSVPDDVAVIGFDDIPDAKNEVFSLSTLRQDTQAQAQAAVAALEAMIAGKAMKARRLIMPVELIVRRTTSSPCKAAR